MPHRSSLPIWPIRSLIRYSLSSKEADVIHCYPAGIHCHHGLQNWTPQTAVSPAVRVYITVDSLLQMSFSLKSPPSLVSHDRAAQPPACTVGKNHHGPVRACLADRPWRMSQLGMSHWTGPGPSHPRGVQQRSTLKSPVPSNNRPHSIRPVCPCLPPPTSASHLRLPPPRVQPGCALRSQRRQLELGQHGAGDVGVVPVLARTCVPPPIRTTGMDESSGSQMLSV